MRDRRRETSRSAISLDQQTHAFTAAPQSLRDLPPAPTHRTGLRPRILRRASGVASRLRDPPGIPAPPDTAPLQAAKTVIVADAVPGLRGEVDERPSSGGCLWEVCGRPELFSRRLWEVCGRSSKFENRRSEERGRPSMISERLPGDIGRSSNVSRRPWQDLGRSSTLSSEAIRKKFGASTFLPEPLGVQGYNRRCLLADRGGYPNRGSDASRCGGRALDFS
jgi:hypothetical protein